LNSIVHERFAQEGVAAGHGIHRGASVTVELIGSPKEILCRSATRVISPGVLLVLVFLVIEGKQSELPRSLRRTSPSL